MRYAILDSCFPESSQRSRGMGAKYLAWEMRRRGIGESAVRDADVILVTCVSPIDAEYVARIRKKYPKKVIICGGAASTSPYSLGLHCDGVCVGDGQSFLDTLFSSGVKAALDLPNAWVHKQAKSVIVDSDFPWKLPPIKCEDGAIRIWCGRGCKNKCAFCQTGWGQEYRENPDGSSVIRLAAALSGKGNKIAYLSNDIAQHSFYKQLPHVEHGSYSVKYLKQHGLPPARQIRLGIEGVSSRLRSLVNKPISHDDLLGCTSWLNKNGKSVRWFLIAGLPGETENDWEELKTVVMDWKRHVSKGVLALSFTAWCPDPATPIAPMPLDDRYWEWFAAFREWFFSGKGWSNRLKLMSPQQPPSRLKKAMFSMGLDERELRTGGSWGPNDRVDYPYKAGAKKMYEKMLAQMG